MIHWIIFTFGSSRGLSLGTVAFKSLRSCWYLIVIENTHRLFCGCFLWPARRDLNSRSPESESVALSSCATGGYGFGDPEQLYYTQTEQNNQVLKQNSPIILSRSGWGTATRKIRGFLQKLLTKALGYAIIFEHEKRCRLKCWCSSVGRAADL